MARRDAGRREPPATRGSPARTPSDVYPSLTYDDAAAAIEWLCRAFGFEKRLVVPGPGNRIEHSELSIGTGVVMVSSPKAEHGRVGPKGLPGAAQGLSVFVLDPDAHHAAAVAAGARILQPPRTEAFGARGYLAEDPEGHAWYFADYRPGEFWTGA